MRKGAAHRVALALGLVAFTACQSADRSPVASTATDAGPEPGTARAAVTRAVPGTLPSSDSGRGRQRYKRADPVPGGPGKHPLR